jgi:hypothetical protein
MIAAESAQRGRIRRGLTRKREEIMNSARAWLATAAGGIALVAAIVIPASAAAGPGPAPHRLAPVRVAPARVAPGRVTPGRVTPGQVAAVHV